MFLHETTRSGTAFNVAAVILGLFVGFPYLLLTMHFYVKPSQSFDASDTQTGLQDRLDALD